MVGVALILLGIICLLFVVTIAMMIIFDIRRKETMIPRKWIDPNKKLPPNSMPVLGVLTQPYEIDLVQYNDNDEKWHRSNNWNYSPEVLFWMPLPDIPEGLK